MKKGLLNETQINKYIVSITEKEIQQGILDIEDNLVENNVLYFERKLTNVENLNKKVLGKFFDLDSNGNIDKEAEELLNELKHWKFF